jgi:hypothetical protein
MQLNVSCITRRVHRFGEGAFACFINSLPTHTMLPILQGQVHELTQLSF